MAVVISGVALVYFVLNYVCVQAWNAISAWNDEPPLVRADEVCLWAAGSLLALAALTAALITSPP